VPGREQLAIRVVDAGGDRDRPARRVLVPDLADSVRRPASVSIWLVPSAPRARSRTADAEGVRVSLDESPARIFSAYVPAESDSPRSPCASRRGRAGEQRRAPLVQRQAGRRRQLGEDEVVARSRDRTVPVDVSARRESTTTPGIAQRCHRRAAAGADASAEDRTRTRPGGGSSGVDVRGVARAPPSDQWLKAQAVLAEHGRRRRTSSLAEPTMPIAADARMPAGRSSRRRARLGWRSTCAEPTSPSLPHPRMRQVRVGWAHHAARGDAGPV
jgi:hypothetical protein